MAKEKIIERKKCSVCDKELLIEQAVADANGNCFCQEHSKNFVLAEEKANKPLLLD